jgi:hypothetical protein
VDASLGRQLLQNLLTAAALQRSLEARDENPPAVAVISRSMSERLAGAGQLIIAALIVSRTCLG